MWILIYPFILQDVNPCLPLTLQCGCFIIPPHYRVWTLFQPFTLYNTINHLNPYQNFNRVELWYSIFFSSHKFGSAVTETYSQLRNNYWCFQLDLIFVIQILSCTNFKRAMSDHDMNSTLHIPNLICTTYSTSCCSTYKQLSFALNWWMLIMLIDI